MRVEGKGEGLRKKGQVSSKRARIEVKSARFLGYRRPGRKKKARKFQNFLYLYIQQLLLQDKIAV